MKTKKKLFSKLAVVLLFLNTPYISSMDKPPLVLQFPKLVHFAYSIIEFYSHKFYGYNIWVQK